MITNQDANLINEDTLAETVEFVWNTFVGTEIVPGGPAEMGEALSAAISVGGQWNATIVCELGDELCRRYSSALLETPVDELSAEDIRDALGELVNVVGGNIKGLLDDNGTSTLSLPVVARPTPAIAGEHITITTWHVADGLPMRWAIHEAV